MNTKIFSYCPFLKAFVWVSSIGRMLDTGFYWYQFFKGSLAYEAYTDSFCMDSVLKIPIKDLIFNGEITDNRILHFNLIGYNFSIFNDWTVRFEKNDNQIWTDDLNHSREIAVCLVKSLC